MRMNSKAKRGFTLIEMLITVSIIGLLAAMAIPTFIKVTKKSRVTAFSRDIKTLASASETYIMESGVWPPDTSAGVFPNELAGYFAKRFFESSTTMGGKWDYEEFSSGITSGIGVHNPNLDDSEFANVDAVVDDGNLSTGRFRKLSDTSYFWVIAD
jgi:prepilin-type N-terminal cleavage/methylation domain-containing protein